MTANNLNIAKNIGTVLLTGSSGYVGSKLTKLLSNEFKFLGVDSTSHPVTTDLELDLRDANAYCALDRYDFDYVIHAACDQLTSNLYQNNAQITDSLFHYLEKRSLKGLIFISSSLVSTPVDIQYTRSKIYAENLLADSTIPYVIVRPDMVYSPDETKFQQQLGYMRRGFSICIGNGRSLRSPTHVSDLSQLVSEVLKANRFLNHVYEIGSPVALSQKSMLKQVAFAHGLNPRFIHIPKSVAAILFKLMGNVDPEQAYTVDHDRVADLTPLYRDFRVIPRAYDNEAISETPIET